MITTGKGYSLLCGILCCAEPESRAELGTGCMSMAGTAPTNHHAPGLYNSPELSRLRLDPEAERGDSSIRSLASRGQPHLCHRGEQEALFCAGRVSGKARTRAEQTVLSVCNWRESALDLWLQCGV